MVEYFNKGGIVMWPILLSSILGVGVCIERIYFLSKVKMNTKEFTEKIFLALSNNLVSEALQICETYQGSIARMLKAGLKKYQKGKEEVEKAIATAGSLEISKMERGLSLLQSIAAIAPLLGFLGTVTGMINTFDAMAGSDPSAVSKGIGEALITTAAGLFVAIPISFFKNYFTNKVALYVFDMEENSINFLNALEELEEKVAQRSSQTETIGGEYLEI